jgi:hypothetical protein
LSIDGSNALRHEEHGQMAEPRKSGERENYIMFNEEQRSGHSDKEFAARMQQAQQAGRSMLGGIAGGTPQPPLLEEITKRILSAAERAEALAMDIETQGIRLFGPLPEQTCDEGNAKVPTRSEAAVDSLYLAVAQLDQSLNRVSSAHSRISRV